MIFATVGTQLPFDRLLSGLDDWAQSQPGLRVLAQTGRTGSDFSHMDCRRFMPPATFADAIDCARVIVSHAGMGSILTAAELGKPIVIMPRRATYGEHRTDHQLATASEMSQLPNVTVAYDSDDLGQALDDLLSNVDCSVSQTISPMASPALLGAVASFIRGARS